MRTFRVNEWALMAAVRLFPRWFGRKSRPLVLRPRKTWRPVRPDLERLDARESPTSLFADPLTASLVSLSPPAQPLPALVQLGSQTPSPWSNGWNSISAVLRHGSIGAPEAAPSDPASPSPLGGEPWVTGWGEGERAPTTPAAMPWTFAAVAFSANLNAISSPESLLQDPFGVDGLVAGRSHASAALGDIAPVGHARTPAYPGSDGAGGGDSAGSGPQPAPALQQNSFPMESNSPGQPNIMLPPGGFSNTFSAPAGGTSGNQNPLGPTTAPAFPLTTNAGNPSPQAQPSSPQPTGPGGSPPASPPGEGPLKNTGPKPVDTLPDFNSCG